MVYTVPCGGFAESHRTVEECARRELSEEVSAQCMAAATKLAPLNLWAISWGFLPVLALEHFTETCLLPLGATHYSSGATTPAVQAHLCGGDLVRLLDDSHPGLLEVSSAFVV